MKPKIILIAEDEQKTRERLRHTLELWSDNRFVIIAVENSEQALEIFQNQKVHLFILDILMPEVTGLELLKRLKKNHIKPTTVIISSYPEFHYAQEAIQLGVIRYLVKPITKQKLIEAIEAALQVEKVKENNQLMEKVVDEHLLAVANKASLSTPVAKGVNYIKNNLKECLSLKEVAAYAHLHPNYFSVLFREQVGMTFSEYITKNKLQEAKKLLVTTDLSINEISESVGYQTPKYFIKIFKAYVGKTPAKYRKSSS